MVLEPTKLEGSQQNTPTFFNELCKMKKIIEKEIDGPERNAIPTFTYHDKHWQMVGNSWKLIFDVLPRPKEKLIDNKIYTFKFCKLNEKMFFDQPVTNIRY